MARRVFGRLGKGPLGVGPLGIGPLGLVLLCVALLCVAVSAALPAAAAAAQQMAEPPQEPSAQPPPAEPPAEPPAPEDLPPAGQEPPEELPGVLLPDLGGGGTPPNPPPPDIEPPPPVVRAIEIRSDVRLGAEDLAQLGDLLTFAVGDPLTDKQLARSLRNLEASGIASRIDTLTRPAPGGDGVVVVVALRANLIVDEVRVTGDTGVLSRSEVHGTLYQREGDPLIETRVLRGFYRLRELLEQRGYFEASVRVDPQIDEARQRAVVVYAVEAGPRAVVGVVRYDGDTAPFTPEQLTEHLRSEVGEPYLADRARGDADRLRDWLVSQKHRAAQVDEPTVEYRPASHSVLLTFPLRVGPLVTVEVVGAERKKLEKRDLLPFLGDEGYDEALLLVSQDRIRTWYQEQGHYDAEVTVDEQQREEDLHIVVTVVPGPEYTLEEVRLTGNETFSDDRLRDLIETAPAGLLTRLPGISGGHLVSDVLAADLDNLRAFYALQGFPDARVGPEDVEKDGHDLRVTIPIHEGERQLVDSLSFEGFEAFDPKNLELTIEQGGPYHPRLLEDSLNALRARYDRQGYATAQVSATTEWDPEHTRARIVVQALEGPQTLVDRVIVRGNDRTDTEVIQRSMSLKPGDPVSKTRLLEVERDLYRLGIFSRVEAELTPAPLGESTRDVVVRVEEGRVRRLTYGAGYDSEDGLGGLVGFSHQNLFGKAIGMSADARVRQRAQQYRLFVDQPYVGNYAVPVNYSLFWLEEDRESFSVLKRGARVEAVKEIHRGPRDNLRFGLAYDYRIVENTSAATGVGVPAPGEPDFHREDQTLQIASLVPSALIDHRDDPINPAAGWNALLQLQYSFPVFAAEADFVKLFLQHTQYFHLGRAGTMVISERAGGIEPLSDLPPDVVNPLIPECPTDPDVPPDGACYSELPSSQVFIAERFFAGGAASNRGYSLDTLGVPVSDCPQEGRVSPDDCAATLFFDSDGNLRPAGGNGLLLVNLEYRFPLFGPVDGAVFYDTGNVWSDWRQIDFASLRAGAGAGVRYVSPIGPIRLDVGFPLDKLPGDDSPVYFLSLGYPF